MAKQKSRTWYRYQQMMGRKVVHCGITQNLKERERETQQKWPGSHLMQVGHKTTKEAAQAWETVHGYNISS